MKGTIFNIQRFSIHDGPNVRTTIFFKGCNLKCLWCHNPESISFKREVEVFLERCINCGRCFEICNKSAHYVDVQGIHRMHRNQCDGCFNCTNDCFAEALVGVGTEITVDDLMKSILLDKSYYMNSGGGVTFSGGECMLQIDFLKALLTKCKENGIHTAIDTAGNLSWSYFEKVLDVTDLFLYDLKAADSKVHENLTGVGNALIIENLKKLYTAGKQIHVRIPYILGVNDDQLNGIGLILKDLDIQKVELLPYHRLGESKYKSLDKDFALRNISIPSEEEIDKAVGILREYTANAVKV
jgi:choline trimethylamine-lyase activating enzyme